MKKFTSAVMLAGVLAAAYGGASAVTASSEFQAQPREPIQFRARLADRQVQQILTRVRTNADALLRTIEPSTPRGRAYGNRARQSGDVAYLVDDLVQATTHLSDHITRRETTRADVEDVLRRASAVDQSLDRTTRTQAAQNLWTNIRRDVDSLASAFNLSWDWRNPQYAGDVNSGVYRQLTGTYTLDVARSDDPRRIVDAAIRTVAVADRARVTRQLTNRLDPPDVIAIDRTDRRVTIASSRGPQLTFDADGQARTEPGFGGRTVTTRASMYGDQLEVSTSGGVNSDFSVTFEPLSGGQALRVTRRLQDEALRQPVTLQTTYRKTSDTPDWSLYNNAGSSRSGGTGRWNPGGGAVVPDGTTLVATLDQSVNLRAAREDDRVTLTVHNAPRAELEGAVIEGYVTAIPTRVNDRTRVSVGFDQIRLRNGRTAAFDGVIERVTGPDGRAINFDGEQVRSDDPNQRDQAIQRGAIGAAVGALIGAVAGGGKGAAIGAAIGAGGAAATVFIDGGNQLELPRGTEFTIRSRAR